MQKSASTVTSLLVVIGGLNWGLVGLGGFLGKDLNGVHMLLGAWPMVENSVYALVGLAALAMGVMYFVKCHDCACQADKK